jgi:hypothetical protein
VSNPVLTLPLLKTLRRRRLYGAHAAGHCQSDRCLLVAGTSGAGQNAAGARFSSDFEILGDGMLFLSTDQLTGRSPRPLLPRRSGCYRHDRRVLSRPARAPAATGGWPKWGFRPEDVFRRRMHGPARPAALVSPRIAHDDTSLLERVPAEAALLELLPHVLLTHPTVCQQHLAVPARLTHEIACCRLMTTRDLTTLPDRMGDLLA